MIGGYYQSTLKKSFDGQALSIAQAHYNRVAADGGTGCDLDTVKAWVKLLLEKAQWENVALSWEIPFGYKLTSGKIEKLYALKGADLAQSDAAKRATLATAQQNGKSAAQFTSANFTHYRGTTALPVSNGAVSMLSNFYHNTLTRGGIIGLEQNSTDNTPFGEFSFEAFADNNQWTIYRGNGTSFDTGTATGVTPGGVPNPRGFNTLLYQLGTTDSILGTQAAVISSNSFPNLHSGFAYSNYIIGGRGASNMFNGYYYGSHLLAAKAGQTTLVALQNFWRTYYNV